MRYMKSATKTIEVSKPYIYCDRCAAEQEMDPYGLAVDWLVIEQPRGQDLTFCSWDCLSKYAIGCAEKEARNAAAATA